MADLTEVRAGDRRGWLAAGDGGHPLGVAWLDDGTATLSIDVHPADRRRGVGSELLRAALDAARAAGHGAVQCEPVEVGSPGEGAPGSVPDQLGRPCPVIPLLARPHLGEVQGLEGDPGRGMAAAALGDELVEPPVVALGGVP